MSRFGPSRCWVRRQTWIIGGLLLAIIWVVNWQPPTIGHMALPQDTRTCWKISSEVQEPDSSEYQFNPLGVDVDGPMWSDYHWEGNITREEFDDAIYRDNRSYVRYKILDNELYIHHMSLVGHTNFTKTKADAFVVGVIVALAMFHVPDVDILADFSVVQQHAGVPSLVDSFIGGNGESPGFAVPGTVSIRKALGPVQLENYHKCLMERYPLGPGRIPKAVWRGKWDRIASTDVPRVKLVKAAATVPRIADVKFSEYRTECLTDACLLGLENIRYDESKTVEMAKREIPPGIKIDQELKNKYALLVDIDGAGHSADLQQFLQFNTPILRQEPQYPIYIWSQLVSENVIQAFSSDSSDFVPVLKRIMDKWKKDPLNYQKEWVDRLHNFAKQRMTHHGVARSMAYALTVYAEKQLWRPKLEPGFVQIDKKRPLLSTLPKPFLRRIKKLVE